MASSVLRLFLLWAVIWSGPAFPASLFGDALSLKRQTIVRGDEVVQIAATPETESAPQVGSLFADRQARGLFAPVIRQDPEPDAHNTRRASSRGVRTSIFSTGASDVIALRSLIAKVEAGRAQYNAVVFSAKIKPPKLPTQMTIAEIYKWIDDTPNQNHAIGRYQFIPSTLRQLVRELGVNHGAQFTPALQDKLADLLLEDAGFARFRTGELSRKQFMHNLARIWAGLPTASGKSYYSGIAGNKAGMSWARFDREMARIFPASKKDAS